MVFWPFSEKNMRFSKKILTKAVQKPYLKTNASGFLHSFSVNKINQKFMSVHVLLRDLLRSGLVRFSILLLHQRPSVKWKILSNPNSKFKLENKHLTYTLTGMKPRLPGNSTRSFQKSSPSTSHQLLSRSFNQNFSKKNAELHFEMMLFVPETSQKRKNPWFLQKTRAALVFAAVQRLAVHSFAVLASARCSHMPTTPLNLLVTS